LIGRAREQGAENVAERHERHSLGKRSKGGDVVTTRRRHRPVLPPQRGNRRTVTGRGHPLTTHVRSGLGCDLDPESGRLVRSTVGFSHHTRSTFMTVGLWTGYGTPSYLGTHAGVHAAPNDRHG